MISFTHMREFHLWCCTLRLAHLTSMGFEVHVARVCKVDGSGFGLGSNLAVPLVALTDGIVGVAGNFIGVSLGKGLGDILVVPRGVLTTSNQEASTHTNVCAHPPYPKCLGTSSERRVGRIPL